MKMKNIFKFMMLALATSVMFTACNKDDDKGNDNGVDDNGVDDNNSAAYGEVLYLSFDEDFTEHISEGTVNVEGNPTISSDAKFGTGSYQGAADSYLTIPSEDYISKDGGELTVAFWFKPAPNSNARAGLFLFGAAEWDGNDNNRADGCRIFHEEYFNEETEFATDAKFGANAGWDFAAENMKGDEWLSLDDKAWFVASDAPEWQFVTLTMKEGFYRTYINGEIAKASEGYANGVDESDGFSPDSPNKLLVPNFKNCELFTIGSGEPTFNYWGMLSELGQIDEFRIFDKALTQEEIKVVMDDLLN